MTKAATKALSYFELDDMLTKIKEVTGKDSIPELEKHIKLFDTKDYIAVRIHTVKEWRKYAKIHGYNFLMVHSEGLYASLRGKQLKIGNQKHYTHVFANGIGFHIIKKADTEPITTYGTVKKFIEADIPVYIEGYSGWGKSSIVNQIAQDLNMPIVTLSLAGISPEDFGGIPRVHDEEYFKYVLPEWALRYNEPFILFLDEINQAPVSVLHACYGLVLDRVLNGRKLPCKIVAAGNFNSENEYLVDMSAIRPLMERFYKYTINHDKADALNFLEKKYNLQLSGLLALDWEQTYLNPRRIEKYIKMILAGITSNELTTDPEVPCESAFYTLERIIKGSWGADDDVQAKVQNAIAGNEVEMDSDTEAAIFNQLMEQEVAV